MRRTPQQAELVALRKESVDRNRGRICQRDKLQESLSVRRAWIEICRRPHDAKGPGVALRKESVDRNINAVVSYSIKRPSLSVRRAWIEIWLCGRLNMLTSVALRKESVDRNNSLESKQIDPSGRSP